MTLGARSGTAGRAALTLAGRVAGDGEEDVVQVGDVDGQLRDLDVGGVELLEQPPQRGDAGVAGHLELEPLLMPPR
jgi:hypothetical protein